MKMKFNLSKNYKAYVLREMRRHLDAKYAKGEITAYEHARVLFNWSQEL